MEAENVKSAYRSERSISFKEKLCHFILYKYLEKGCIIDSARFPFAEIVADCNEIRKHRFFRYVTRYLFFCRRKHRNYIGVFIFFYKTNEILIKHMFIFYVIASNWNFFI